MKRSKIFKIVAITNFVVLFTVFLLYATGSFNSNFYKKTDSNFTSSNGGVGVKHTVDSIYAAYDSLQRLQRLRASSSKSLVVRDYVYYDPGPKAPPKKDSNRVNPTEYEKVMMLRSKPDKMSGSKSGTINWPKMFIVDSLLKEKEKQKKQQ
jgi:hypothetical protein